MAKAELAWQCPECERILGDYDTECPTECTAELDEVVVFDGEICEHHVTNGYGVCAACGWDLND